MRKIEMMNPIPRQKLLSENVGDKLPQQWIERVDWKQVDFDTSLQKVSHIPGKERIDLSWKLAGENSKPHSMFFGEALGCFVCIWKNK